MLKTIQNYIIGNTLIAIVIVIILVLCFFLHYESKYSELTYVQSEVDGEQYLVRNRKDKKEGNFYHIIIQ